MNTQSLPVRLDTGEVVGSRSMSRSERNEDLPFAADDAPAMAAAEDPEKPAETPAEPAPEPDPDPAAPAILPAEEPAAAAPAADEAPAAEKPVN